MRLFIAFEIPAENRLELESVQVELKKIIPQVRLTENNKLHLTIAFIGEQSDNLTGQLIEVIKVAVKTLSSFEVTPAYIDGFPKLHNAHTLWVGVKGDIDKLLLIREKIKDGLVSLNLDVDERRFIPHIAIAKVTNFRLSDWQELQLEKLMTQNFSPIKLTSVKLFESVPDQGFHTHNTLARIDLTSLN